MLRRALLVALSLTQCFAPSRPVRTATTHRPPWLELLPRRPGADAGALAAGRCPESAVYVPGATFQMGIDSGASDERPTHSVTLGGYCIDRTEVTSEVYTLCVTRGACARPSGAQTESNRPVTGVDWEQASSYCRFVGGRLPTEAEWELAARGTDARLYPWGSTPPAGCQQLDWTAPEGSCGGVGPSAVGASPLGASPYGAMDMAGNVWEWTSDWYAASYSAEAQRDPTGPVTGSSRVTRGGGWNNDQPERLRATWREGQHPSFHDYDLGLRCAFAPASAQP